MNLTAGTVLQNGQYVISATLGQGYFGTTYRAMHTHLEQPVVIKTLSESLRHYAEFSQFQQRFIQQARRIAKCQHSSLARVLDLFEENGRSFMVVDYIGGPTLTQLMKKGQPLPLTAALHYIRQVASALSVVHRQGLLHLDLKPDNLIRRSGSHRVMLVDFGIAHEFTVGAAQTHAGLLSAGYAPIEQYDPKGKRTPATDIYSLSATLYHLLTGQAPVTAPLRDRIPLVGIRYFQPNLSPDMEQAIMCGLDPDAKKRVPTVEAWLKLLQSDALKRKSQGVVPAATRTPEVERVQEASIAPEAEESKPSGAKSALVQVTQSVDKPDSQESEVQENWHPGFRPWIPALFVATSLIAGIGGASFVFALRSNLANGLDSDRSSIKESFPTRRFPRKFNPKYPLAEEEFPSDLEYDWRSESQEFSPYSNYSNTSEPASYYREEPTSFQVQGDLPQSEWEPSPYSRESIDPSKAFLEDPDTLPIGLGDSINSSNPNWSDDLKDTDEDYLEPASNPGWPEPEFSRPSVEKYNSF